MEHSTHSQFKPSAWGPACLPPQRWTLLALRGQSGIPRWLGALGLIAFLEQCVETITIFGSTGFTQPGGAMNMQLGAGLTFVWILAFGFWGGFRGRVS
jgi:hypothetical protein